MLCKLEEKKKRNFIGTKQITFLKTHHLSSRERRSASIKGKEINPFIPNIFCRPPSLRL